jgi:hypothetical protein
MAARLSSSWRILSQLQAVDRNDPEENARRFHQIAKFGGLNIGFTCG